VRRARRNRLLSKVRMHSGLELVLILLAAAVLVAAAARALRLPTMLGYLVTGIAIGPYALGWIPDSEEARYLAEFGVVFLMFSIGLEFSLPRLMTMRMTVFGFGGAQVVLTIALTTLMAWLFHLPLLTAIALGGIMSMSSTAIVSKMMAERLEIQTPHGRQIFGALLFQDLAVVPLLILIPAFAKESDAMAATLGLAMFKAVVVLGFLLFVGQRIMRPWFQWVAGYKSPELFTLNLLLFTLGLAFLTESAGLSLALGAFLAGMLVSETEYRYQVEDDIKPFRDVLLGLFFVTIGMRLDLMQVMQNWGDVLLLVAAIVIGKAILVSGLSLAFGSSRPTAVRTALGLAQAGEFGFVLLAQAADLAGDHVVGGLYSPHCAAIQPARLARGLAQVLERSGVRIFERTPVQEIAPRSLIARSGSVTGEACILACEGYTPRIAGFERALAPIHSRMIVTAPLNDTQWRASGLARRICFGDSNRMVAYGQVTADRRIAFGARGDYHFASRIEDRIDRDDPNLRAARERLPKLVPGAGELEITHAWTGPLGVSRARRPFVFFDAAAGFGWAGGYLGQGVAASCLAGHRLSRAITASHELPRDDLLVTRCRPRKFEAEPVRWLGISAYRQWLTLLDRLDR